MGCPIFHLLEARLVTLESDPGTAVLQEVAKPRQHPSSHPFLHKCIEDGMGAGQFKCLLQVDEDSNGGAVVDMSHQGEDTVCCAHSAGVAKYVWVRGPYVPL
ncbi:hypothetical protein Pmani_000899 [Petrolisthes manimaculis]|uniref:Uncharacterized protein n=1 Tax=Petrolisthes manimaculis TaxID=1843537 RepID=A0AAE1QLI7_9EUCA|nr:hypothetical protein Pmani_000899 [Petrolisthes manimaculis]